jgi:hypothetical protein
MENFQQTQEMLEIIREELERIKHKLKTYKNLDNEEIRRVVHYRFLMRERPYSPFWDLIIDRTEMYARKRLAKEEFELLESINYKDDNLLYPKKQDQRQELLGITILRELAAEYGEKKL